MTHNHSSHRNEVTVGKGYKPEFIANLALIFSIAFRGGLVEDNYPPLIIEMFDVIVLLQKAAIDLHNKSLSDLDAVALARAIGDVVI